jgi:thioredoxin 1
MSQVAKLDTKGDFDRALANCKREGSLMVVDFTAEWCGPCQQIAPSIEAMAQEMPDVRFFKVDVDDNDDVATEYSITAMPTFLYFLGGALKTTIKGADLGKIKAETIGLRPKEHHAPITPPHRPGPAATGATPGSANVSQAPRSMQCFSDCSVM